MRTTFDRDCLVDDIALNARRGREPYLEAPYTPDNATIDDHIICRDLALDRRTFANRQQMRADVTFDGPFDLNITGCLHITRDVQVRRQN